MFATDQADAAYDALILGYIAPSCKTSQQYDDKITSKSFNVSDVYVESTLDEFSIEGVESLTQHSFCNV